MEVAKSPRFLRLRSLLTEEEIMIRDMVRDWVDEEVLDIEHACRDSVFLDKWRKDLGAMGVPCAPQGLRLPGAYYVAYGLICQELERGDSGLRSFSLACELASDVPHLGLRHGRTEAEVPARHDLRRTHWLLWADRAGAI